MSARPESFRPHHDVDSLRVPPQSVESEQAVLGALLLSAEAIWSVKGFLVEADFYRRDHRLIYRGIIELSEKEKPFDAVTLGEWFEANGISEQIGGPSYLIDLASTTPSAANIRAYAEIVREKSVLRQLIEAGTEIVNDGFQPEGESAGTLAGRAQERLFQIAVPREVNVKSAKQIAKEAYDDLQAVSDRGEQNAPGLMTGFADLDDATAGLQPEDFVIVAARPGIGKTVLGLNVARGAASKGKHVAVWSLEMSSAQLTRRLQSDLTGIAHDTLKRPWRLTNSDWAALGICTKTIGNMALSVMDDPDLTIDQLEAQAYRLHMRRRLDLIVIDYIGLMNLPRAERHELAMGEISRRLKKLAKRLKVPIIGLHQLNRQMESAKREPMLSDLRDTGRFEQDADMILLLHRERYYDESAPDDCQLHIAKQRGGPTKRIGLACDLAHCRFGDYEGRWIPYMARKKAAKGKATEGFDDDDYRPPRIDGKAAASGGDE